MFPIEYVGWNPEQYYDVTFTDDFGVFKKGNFVEFLCIEDDQFLVEYDEHGRELKRQEFKVIPV